MPPEPVPWDRKELGFKDRKHERATGYDTVAGGSGGAAPPRWRDTYHASPRRPPPPGHYRQGGGYYPQYPQEPGGGTPSRSGGRSGREGRGPFRRSPTDLPRQHHDAPLLTGQRSVAVPVPQVSSEIPSKGQPDKSGGGDVGSGTGRSSSDRDRSLGSIGWKPSKWTRPGGLSSLKALNPGVEASLPTGKDTTIQSPLTSPPPADDNAPRKKARLTWGQGLAKFERKKVEGSTDAASTNADSGEKNSKAAGFTGSSSPGTLCPAISSSSPEGLGHNPFKELKSNTTIPSDLSGPGLQHCVEDLSTKLDPFGSDSITTLTSLLADLLQPEDACTGDSSYTRHTAMGKLLALKAGVSVELEKTECEIDSLENELKTASKDERNDPPHNEVKSMDGYDKNELCQGSMLQQADCASNPSPELGDATSKVPLDCTLSKEDALISLVKPAIEPHSDSDSVEDQVAEVKEDQVAEVKDMSDDGPGSCTSKCGRSSSLVKGDSGSDALELDGCPVVDGKMSPTVHCDGKGGFLDACSSNDYSDLGLHSSEKTGNDLVDRIMASNRVAAREASQVFDKALSSIPPWFDIWEPDCNSLCRRNITCVREKLAARKGLLKFKERVHVLKFRALHHMWKEDLRLLSIKKHKAKSQKRLELSGHHPETCSQKHRSSVRSRFILPGCTFLVPTNEILNFTSKLLSDSQIKLYRTNVKMPNMILDEMERRLSQFVSNNGLIEDPLSFEKERTMINPWTPKEKELFMEMLATFGKDFAQISSFLTHKTTADCIEFYYKNHKSDSFREVKLKLNLRKQQQCLSTRNYLVTSGKKWNPESNAGSLDMLGEASALASHSNGSTKNPQKCGKKSILSGSFHDSKISRGSFMSPERTSSVEISRSENETTAADVLAGIRCGVSSEAMSSCITGSFGPAEKMSYVGPDMPLVSEVTQNIDEDSCSDEDCGEVGSVDWTDGERTAFIKAVSLYGNDFASISRFVATRSREQCKIYFSKARKCLGLDMIHPGPDGGKLTSYTNGGKSDTDDAGAAELDSAICSTQSCSKPDADFAQSGANTGGEGFISTGNTSMHCETDRSSEQYEVGGSILEEVQGKSCDVLASLSEKNPARLGDIPHSDKLLIEKDEGSPRKSAVVVSMEVEQSKSYADVKDRQKDIVGSFNGELKTEVDLQQHVIPKSHVFRRQSFKVEKYEVDRDAENSPSLCLAPGSSTNGNNCNSESRVEVSNGFDFSNSQHQVSPESMFCLQNLRQVVQVKQEKNPLTISSSRVMPDPSVNVDGHHCVTPLSILSFEDQGFTRHQSAAASSFYQQYTTENQSLDQLKQQPLHIFRGYPLQVSNMKRSREADYTGENPVPSVSISKGNGIPRSNLFLFSAVDIDECKGSLFPNSLPEVIHPARSRDQSEVLLRPSSQASYSETEQSHRTGDVKLFGQILSHPSSLQKCKSSTQECDRKSLSPKLNNSVNLNPSIGGEDQTSMSKPGTNSYTGPMELPLRSYGFWDGNRIQTGYSSLPEALMLAKYPESISGASSYAAQNSFPSSSRVIPDYQQVYTQTLAAERKRLDSLANLQKQNGFEVVSGLQQQGMPMLCANMVGGGTAAVGAGVSDPVASIKMRYVPRANILTSKVEPWRDGRQ